MNILFDQRLKEITQEHETLLKRKNREMEFIHVINIQF